MSKNEVAVELAEEYMADYVWNQAMNCESQAQLAVEAAIRTGRKIHWDMFVEWVLRRDRWESWWFEEKP